MKVGFYAPVIPINSKAAAKSGDRDSGGSGGFQRQQKSDQEEKGKFEATFEALDSEIEKFGDDEKVQAYGITAESTGQGPGLKVVLKDPSGGVLRSVSGEEFLKLREAANAGRRSGRILDQKA